MLCTYHMCICQQQYMGIYVVYVLHVIRVHTHISTQHNTCVDICIHISCHVCIDTHTMYLCMCMYRCTDAYLHKQYYMLYTCIVYVPCGAHVQYSIQYTVVLCICVHMLCMYVCVYIPILSRYLCILYYIVMSCCVHTLYTLFITSLCNM